MPAISGARALVRVGSAVTATAGWVAASTTPLRSTTWPRDGSRGSLVVSWSAVSAAYADESKPCSCNSRPAHNDKEIASTRRIACNRLGPLASGMRKARLRFDGRRINAPRGTDLGRPPAPAGGGPCRGPLISGGSLIVRIRLGLLSLLGRLYFGSRSLLRLRGSPLCGQLGGRTKLINLHLKGRLIVGERCGLPVEGTELERLVLQCGVEHQQSRHAESEEGDQHKNEGKASEPVRQARYRPEPSSLGRIHICSAGSQRCPQRTHPAAPRRSGSAIRTAARNRADAARGLTATSAAEGRAAPLISSFSCGRSSTGTTGRSRGA